MLKLKVVLCGMQIVQEREVIGRADSGTKLYLCNLDYGVFDEDFEVYFFFGYV